MSKKINDNTDFNDLESFPIVQEDILNRNVWRKKAKNKKGYVEVEISEMTEKSLQSAYKTANAKLLFYHNKTMIFDKLVCSIEEEAEAKGINLEPYDSNFHKNRAIFKKRINVTEEK
jgi:hypothetical protein